MARHYHLDYNHAPNLYYKNIITNKRVRSGDSFSIDMLNKLEDFFTTELCYDKAGFFDYSASSIAKLLIQTVSNNSTLAVSRKLSYFCIEAVRLCELMGLKIVWVDADKSGFLSEESLKQSKEAGAEFLFCATVDEDTFIIENMSLILKYFDNNQLILDVSNGIKKLDPPKAHMIFFWGYKLASFKNSAIYLCNNKRVELLESIDLAVFCHIKNAYKSFKTTDNNESKKLFINILQKTLGENFSTFVNPDYTLNNSISCRFKNIIARDFIRTLALENIHTTNGELCALGLSKPSRILQTLGYSETETRECLSITFEPNIESSEIVDIANKICFKYLQIKAILA